MEKQLNFKFGILLGSKDFELLLRPIIKESMLLLQYTIQQILNLSKIYQNTGFLKQKCMQKKELIYLFQEINQIEIEQFLSKKSILLLNLIIINFKRYQPRLQMEYTRHLEVLEKKSLKKNEETIKIKAFQILVLWTQSNLLRLVLKLRRIRKRKHAVEFT